MQNDTMIENPMVIDALWSDDFDPFFDDDIDYCTRCNEVTNSGWPVCDDCIQQAITLENAIRYGAERKEVVEINGFYASAFTDSQIEEIVKREYERALKLAPQVGERDAKNYCRDDLGDFLDWMEEKNA